MELNKVAKMIADDGLQLALVRNDSPSTTSGLTQNDNDETIIPRDDD